MLTSRLYDDPAELRLLQELAIEVRALHGDRILFHPGGLAWDRHQHVGREAEWPTRLWLDDGACVAWAWVQLPDELSYLVHPERPELEDELLDWARGEAPGPLDVTALEGDDRGAPWFSLLLRGLDELEQPAVPSGYRLRTVEEGDFGRRVAVHRAAWHLSQVTEESYAKVQATWPYRAELDCVAEAPDGSFASYCLAWLDERNRIGELEPVGTHPDHRRRGLAGAVSLYALARLREAGADRALVMARGDPDYAEPRRVYERIGFGELARTARTTLGSDPATKV